MDEMLTKGFPAVDGVETTEDTEDGFGFRKGVPDIGGESAEGNAESLREFSEQPIPVADDARAGPRGGGPPPAATASTRSIRPGLTPLAPCSC